MHSTTACASLLQSCCETTGTPSRDLAWLLSSLCHTSQLCTVTLELVSVDTLLSIDLKLPATRTSGPRPPDACRMPTARPPTSRAVNEGCLMGHLGLIKIPKPKPNLNDTNRLGF